jgi:hypothetical protein
MLNTCWAKRYFAGSAKVTYQRVLHTVTRRQAHHILHRLSSVEVNVQTAEAKFGKSDEGRSNLVEGKSESLRRQ